MGNLINKLLGQQDEWAMIHYKFLTSAGRKEP